MSAKLVAFTFLIAKALVKSEENSSSLNLTREKVISRAAAVSLSPFTKAAAVILLLLTLRHYKDLQLYVCTLDILMLYIS